MSAPTPRRRRTRRAASSLVAVAAVALVPAFGGPALAEPDPSDPSVSRKGVPDLAEPAAAPLPTCDLHEGAHARDEFAQCTNVVLSASSAPELGGSTTVDVDVTSVADLETATLTVLVNRGFNVVDTGGFSSAGTKMSGVGPMAAYSRTISLSADQTESFSIEVNGARGGIAVVQARLNTAGGMFDGGDELAVRLGQQAPVSDRGMATTRVARDARMAPRTAGVAPYRRASVSGPRSLSPEVANGSCATGGWFFVDEQALTNPSMNFQIQIWDDDSGDDDLLAVVVTGGDGRYNACFESTDGEGGGQEVYVRAVSSNNAWRVRNTAASNNDYIWNLGSFNYGDPGGTHEFGNLQSGDPAYHRAVHAFDGINRLWLWHSGVSGYLDNPGQTRQMIVNWTPTSTDGTYYSLGGNDIHLAAADPDADHTTIHEGAHALMDAIYNDAFPAAPNCNPHSIFGPSSTGCAWTEGWAEWVPARVLNDPFYRWPGGASLDLESPSWGDYTGAYGDTAEGRIAGALIDLSDTNNDAYWDRYTEGGSSAASEEIYTTNIGTISDTLADYFINDRPGEGDTGYLARAALFQNTVNYTHRDPLFHGAELIRPSLASTPNPHNYSFSFSSFYWSGVAIRPPGGADYDLTLYADEAQSNLLTTSAGGTGAIDYVLVDGNHRNGTYFPRSYLWTGSGVYRVEQFTGGSVLPVGTSSYSFTSNDVIRTWDASVSAGQTNYVRVVPESGLDVGLYGHDSDGTQADAVQRRSVADGTSNTLGVGGAEAIEFSSPDTDWAGVVITNNGGSGSYTVYRDVAPPSAPTVQIDGGNASTYDTNVALTLSAVAANTPVTEMQISTDGVFDSEPWQAYSTSGSANVPGGVGTKTVTVRYRSAAGAISAPASDTINLVATPTCDGQPATIAGFGTVNGTAGNDVIVGGGGNDTINGFGGNDLICGLGGADTITDGPGADTVRGAGGNDTFKQGVAADAGDVFDGGANIDTMSYQLRSNGVTVTLNGLANDGEAGEGDLVSNDTENVIGGSGNDSITASAAANTVTGNGGNDVINGGDANDTLRGLAGNDVVNGGGGNDIVDGGNDNDVLRGDAGNDKILGGNGDDSVDEGTGANGADVISGNAGNDRVTYASRAVAVSIRLNGDPTSGAAGEGDRVTGFEEAVGGSGNDTISGHINAEKLVGNAGNDTIVGNGANDTITGGVGNDNLSGGAGDDWLNSKDNVNGNDTVNGGADTDTAVVDPGDIVTNVP